jgi:Leucine-rich repeat (LRR) protein
MKKILLFAFTIAMLATISCSKNEEDNSVVPIPDPVFKAYLLKLYDYNHNGEISFSEANEIYFVDCQPITYGSANPYANIVSFAGIEYFTNLDGFICDGCKITSSLDFSANTKLSFLKIINTELSSLNVSKCVDLYHLDCHANKLISLDVTRNVNLIMLNFSENKLSEIDVSQNVLLRELYCEFNFLEILDLHFNINMTTVWCNMESLKKLILITGHQYEHIGSYYGTDITYL